MRRQARELCFKYIYMQLFNNENQNNFDVLYDEDNIVDKSVIDFAKTLIEIWDKNKEEIVCMLNDSLINYEPGRVYRIDLALLYLGITEICFYKETPSKVVINEVLEIAKQYSTEKSYLFINGILASIIKEKND